MLRDVKTGDWIFVHNTGWCVVEKIADGSYPVKTGKASFGLEGKIMAHDIHPSAWTYNPYDPDDQPPVAFKDGEIVMKNFPSLHGNERPVLYFKGIEGNIRKQTAKERGDE